MKTPSIRPLPAACPEWANRLGARQAGDLSRAEWAALQEHLASCANCSAVFAAYRAVDAQILSLPVVEPSAEQVIALRALVAEKPGRELRTRLTVPAREQSRGGERAPFPLAARISLLVVILVALVGGLYGLFALHHLGPAPVPAATFVPSPTPAPTHAPSHVIYAVSDTGTVFAVNADTGKTIWSTALHVQASEQFVVAGGKLFFGDNNYVLYALDVSNGHLVWSHSYKALTVGSQTSQIAPYPASDGKALYFGTPSGIYAWDASDGQTLWDYPTTAACKAQDICAPEVMTVSNGVVYAYAGGLYALNAADGKKLWQAAQVPDDTPLVVTQDTVYVGGHNTPLEAFQVANGQPYSIPGLARVNPVDELLVVDGTVIVRTRSSPLGTDVYAVRASDDRVLWFNQYYEGGAFDGELGGTFFYVSGQANGLLQATPVTDPTGNSQQYDGYLCAASIVDGSTEWCIQLLGSFTSQLEVVRNGTLYITTLGGVEAIRLNDGKQLWFGLDSVTLAHIEFD